MDSWRDFWGKKKGDVKSVDIMCGLTYLMAPKEEGELANIKKAAQVTSDVFSKYLKEQIMDIIDNDKVTFNRRTAFHDYPVIRGELLQSLFSNFRK